jgi:VWFA-related protein
VPVTDLTRDDFEVLENGQPQTLDAFERVLVTAAGPQETRVEPNTVAESRAMLASSRARVFVLFLDAYHVSVDGSHRIQKPLVQALDRLIGPEDLIGVMTPEMSASDVTFARKTTTIEGFLTRHWPWGERDRLNSVDAVDDQYRACYPGLGPNPACRDDDRGVADEMIDRRRESLTLSALGDLVRYLRSAREERKAVLTITDGWRMFRPHPDLARRLYCQAPAPDPIGVDPRSGKLGTVPKDPTGATPSVCERDRMALALLDDDQELRRIADEANRANVAFYPIDPRGLVVFDEPISKPTTGAPPGATTTIVPPSADNERLTARLTSLRTLAGATDGLAILNSNDLAAGFRRVVDDLSSYYLLGYYSTAKLDGKFHSITVRVKRPGIEVRARRGYLSATAAEAERATRGVSSGATMSATQSEALAMEAVLGPLMSFSREASLRLRAVAGWRVDGVPQVWLVGELGAADAWKMGGDVDVQFTKDGTTLASVHGTVAPGTRTFKIALTPAAAIGPGDYTISVRTRATSMLASSTEMVPLPLPAPPAIYGSVLVRRGPFTGLKEVPTADLRFRRSERLRVEIPAPPGGDVPAARLLDRTGKPMAVPVNASTRDDADGTRWLTGEVVLYPLGPGDYVVEIAADGIRSLTPFRIVP